MQRRLNNEKSSLAELKDLAETAGYTVVSEITQVRRADPRYQIGAGKVAEIKNLIKETNAEKLIFDNLLKPRQSYNLAKTTGVEAIDRFKLILEIFTKNAKTKEAKLQIQLATLEYERTHAKERVRLAKLTEQPGFMGLGAYEIDVYYEAINRQINTILKKLRKIREKRALHRDRRVELGFLSISLAGYTSAGKSSLFNSLTDETTQVDESLFTTLSTTTRLMEISKKKFLLTDTVGFIDRLPLRLIEAFHSTLEETIYSDLVILVLDISESIDVIEKKFNICINTIDQIGASQIPVIIVLNKIDMISKSETQRKVSRLDSKMKNPILISALYKKNLNLLKQEIIKRLEKYVFVSIFIPQNEETMNFISWIYEKTQIDKILYSNLGVKARLKINQMLLSRVKNKVNELNGKFEEIP